MIEAIIREYTDKHLYSTEIITQLINTIIIVVARNVAMFPAGKAGWKLYRDVIEHSAINELILQPPAESGIFLFIRVPMKGASLSGVIRWKGIK